MTADQRTIFLRRELLLALESAGSYMLPEPVLHAQLIITCAPPPATYEFLAALRHAEAEGWAISVFPDMGGPCRWKLTTKGKALLAEP